MTRIKNMPPLVQELKDKSKMIHYLRKLIRIRSKTKEENNSNSHKLTKETFIQFHDVFMFTNGEDSFI